MFFRFPDFHFTKLVLAVTVAACLLPLQESLAQEQALRICADPNNLPFSNAKQQGFENRIAQLIAADLHVPLTYRWQRMDRGFIREYLDKSECDALMGIPTRSAHVLTTAPYYRSTYVFVYRRNSQIKPSSLDDPALRTLKIGVQAVGEEYTPPGDALARRELQAAIVPFHTTGGDEDEILNAVANRKIDTAIVWGPPAGYFAQLSNKNLELIPIVPEMDPPGLPFTFAISMGVRKGNVKLRADLDAALERHRDDIRSILAHYGIPQLALSPSESRGGK